MGHGKRELYALTIPTGIGAQIGGFAGDYGFIAREFAKHFDLIVNPNAVNGGILSAINENMHYVEGWALDEYLCGNLDLIPHKANKIGVIFDCAIPKNILNVHINTINACKMVMGLDIIGYEPMQEAVGIEFEISGGISVGNVLNPKTMLKAGKKLIEQGAEALAVVCFFPDAPESDDASYCGGKGIDPIGGVEGIISHYLVSELLVPAAHSPAFSSIEISGEIENEKVSSELISSTYLPCVLMGLENAPHIAVHTDKNDREFPLPKGIIVPSSALGSKGVLGAIKNGIEILAVKNPSEIDVTADKLGFGNIIHFENYFECLDYLLKK